MPSSLKKCFDNFNSDDPWKFNAFCIYLYLSEMPFVCRFKIETQGYRILRFSSNNKNNMFGLVSVMKLRIYRNFKSFSRMLFHSLRGFED